MSRIGKLTLIASAGWFLMGLPVLGEDSPATTLLKARTAEFDQEIIKVADDVYTAVGYSVQPVSTVVGNNGIIIVDTGMDTVSAEQILADFRKITDKPVGWRI